ncbi:MAG: hypothetical protein A2096_14895 [Spirochaetes bacterium GWF1_41_5]|nr:MAG: hypothetical protein A2096_14895 [Spirochaetes bacterium GWF1_41_5]
MLFHTWEFMIFFLIVFPVYLFLKKNNRYMNTWLLIASYFFYGWWNPLYLILIIISTLIDYCAGIGLSRPKARRYGWLIMSMVNNLFLLGFFKYYGFFAANFNELASFLHLGMRAPLFDITLPVGISFFTFQSMSYTIDVYRNRLKVETNFIRFASFVSLFPQLVAGPIERASNLLLQLEKEPEVKKKMISDGLSLFLVGLFKKIALADFMAKYADKVYNSPGEFSSLALVCGTIAFAWQIFFDFSGYTDMARGIAKFMGFELMINFNNPYTATGLRDFWQRWHISLSTWFKDYVYIPLGGSRKNKFHTYKNMMLTMIISGFWHGAAWTFLIWGTLHAVGRALTMELEEKNFYQRIPRLAKQIFIFAFACLTWVYFRGRSVTEANGILARIFRWDTAGRMEIPVVMFIMIGIIWIYELMFNSSSRKILELAPVRIGLALVMLVYIAFFATAAHNQFIYFQF